MSVDMAAFSVSLIFGLHGDGVLLGVEVGLGVDVIRGVFVCVGTQDE